jgi:hypothetical protein
MRRAVLGVLFVWACAARSEIAGDLGGGDDSLDGSSSFDSTTTKLDGSKTGDGSPFGSKDGGTTGSDACADAALGIGCAGPNGGNCDAYGCKFNLESNCGGNDFRVGGACEPTDGSFQGFYEGVCQVNGKTVSTFDVPTTTCDCKDASTFITLVQEKCEQQ